MKLKNEFTNEHERLKRCEKLLSDYYYNTLITYQFLWTEKENKLYKFVSQYIFKILLNELTYEELQEELKNEPYYFVDSVKYYIQLLLIDTEISDEQIIIEYIRIDRKAYFMYLIFILTRCYFNTLKLEKYEYEKFYNKYFIFNLGVNQNNYINLFRIIDALNKYAI